MRTLASHTALGTLLVLALIPLTTNACAAPAERSEAATPAPPDQVLTVRGRVRQLPDPDHAGRQLIIAHEAIPDFRDDRGETVGMPAMTMPFPVTDPTVLDGVTIGDAVRFVFESRAHDGPPVQVTSVERLPADTVLDFEQDRRPPPQEVETPPEDDTGNTGEDTDPAH